MRNIQLQYNDTGKFKANQKKRYNAKVSEEVSYSRFSLSRTLGKSGFY